MAARCHRQAAQRGRAVTGRDPSGPRLVGAANVEIVLVRRGGVREGVGKNYSAYIAAVGQGLLAEERCEHRQDRRVQSQGVEGTQPLDIDVKGDPLGRLAFDEKLPVASDSIHQGCAAVEPAVLPTNFEDLTAQAEHRLRVQQRAEEQIALLGRTLAQCAGRVEQGGGIDERFDVSHGLLGHCDHSSGLSLKAYKV